MAKKDVRIIEAPEHITGAVDKGLETDNEMKNLTFEGDQMTDQNERGIIGAYFLDAGGSIENCRFVGFREKTPNASETFSEAIRFWSDLATMMAP